ncbi:(2Fe-2S) ferredoxin domain-containing protein [Saccharothrix hoggarensis]|uniref:(2Fe-2S) ferredoxin domain-containing protein n=1 Tax=Saccharothrix hoggarensis TaxID=913853 RepID=A0ABW3R1K3_9PSEU
MSDSSKVTVCRGCCCGTAEKHPDVDHVRQLRRFREGAGPRAVTVANCLSSCESSNVVVVRPARGVGARPVWLGGVFTDEAVDHILGWVAAGGPGRAEMPAGLADHLIERPADDSAAS